VTNGPRRAAVVLGHSLVLLALTVTVGVAVVRYTGIQEYGFRMMGIAGASAAATAVAGAVALAGAQLVLLGHRRPVRGVALSLLGAAVPVVLLVQMTAPGLSGALFPERSTEGPGFTILTQNLFFQADDPRGVLDAVLERGADVLVLTEFTPEYEALLDSRSDIDRIRSAYPHQWREPAPSGGGLAVLSSLPIERAVPVPLSAPAVMIELGVAGEQVDLYAVHPVAPSDRWGLRQWQHDYRVLTGDAEDAPGRTVMAGDFNASTGHRAFRRLLRSGDLRDASDVGGAGVVGTWPSGWLIPPVMRLDHILVGDGIGVEHVEVLDHIGSDHRGVEARLRVARS
jgi:endonuclease/exonuclease/phosphatase (EEP) superfamily protein YafD